MAGSARIQSIDVVRGLLMVLIICTHTFSNLDPNQTGALNVARLLMTGTVGFATISGALAGYFVATKEGPALERMLKRYAAQGVRLLLIAHPVISVALYAASPNFIHHTTHPVFMTDVLGAIFLLIVPRLVGRRAPWRMMTGLLLVVVGRLYWITPTPSNRGLLLARDLLAGVDPMTEHVLDSGYGLLPIVGMFLVGSWIGDHLARTKARGQPRVFMRGLVRGSLVAFAASIAMIAVWVVCRLHIGGIDAPLVRKFFYPDYDLTLYPFYLAAVALLWAWLLHRGALGAVSRFLEVIGRASLFVYVLQYYVVMTIPRLLGWRPKRR